ncbi:MAG TPA: hypothetical protein VMU39_24870, partial [Solirubrobacteraceae bacterium]|nr:hypothetical protein [Solirubrobacteraceae bacterium]
LPSRLTHGSRDDRATPLPQRPAAIELAKESGDRSALMASVASSLPSVGLSRFLKPEKPRHT